MYIIKINFILAIRDIIVFNIRRIIFIVNIIHLVLYDGKKKIILNNIFKNNKNC